MGIMPGKTPYPSSSSAVAATTATAASGHQSLSASDRRKLQNRIAQQIQA